MDEYVRKASCFFKPPPGIFASNVPLHFPLPVNALPPTQAAGSRLKFISPGNPQGLTWVPPWTLLSHPVNVFGITHNGR